MNASLKTLLFSCRTVPLVMAFDVPSPLVDHPPVDVAALRFHKQESSHHSDSIITEDERARDYFMNRVDSACVYHNCSTRFSDGEEFGFGAEIGIGTDKFHARGPMALRELTSYKYVIEGDGQMKDPSRVPRKGRA